MSTLWDHAIEPAAMVPAQSRSPEAAPLVKAVEMLLARAVGAGVLRDFFERVTFALARRLVDRVATFAGDVLLADRRRRRSHGERARKGTKAHLDRPTP